MLYLPTLVYWSSLGIVAYTYAGYPALVQVLSRLKPRTIEKKPIEPDVSIVLAAHNEEASIGRKLENLLELDYPQNKKEIVVACDGSTDRTAEIVREYSGSGVKLVALEKPSGKPTALNRALEVAEGEIVVFCDARQIIDKDALKILVSCFSDPQIGAVSGELHIKGQKGPGLYWKYEKSIRAAEGRLDSVPGATGALFAIRRKLFRPIPPESLLDDVYTPMQIVLSGYRTLFEPSAKVWDDEAEISTEFRRKARTLAGNFQILDHLPGILNPLKNRIFWQYTSHKLMRLVCPFALIGLLGSNLLLVLKPSPLWPLYLGTLAGQSALYALALRGAILEPEKCGRFSRIAHTFVVLNAAALEGLKRYIKRDFAW
ncbi:MAG: glycosyltransferase family 2 protein [Deltaproteobacteria bacterium]|nr:glycosyltransferase family 2 protein [Deltaproteobacteria bacterium]